MKTIVATIGASNKPYTYIATDRVAEGLHPGAEVLMQVREHDVKSGRVLEVHDDDRRDPNATWEYRYIYGPTENFRALLDGELLQNDAQEGEAPVRKPVF